MEKNNLLRITQINSIYLDKEIEKSFQQIIQKACQNLSPGLIAPIYPEINLLLRLGLIKYSVIDKGSTFGQQLLNIKYIDISSVQKFLYILMSSFGYLKERSELWNPSHNINKHIFKFYIILKICDLINISIFLRNGIKPQLIERVLGLNQIYATETTARTFQSKYLARELLWNGFIEILVHILPLINYHKIKRIVSSRSPFYKIGKSSPVSTSIKITMHTKCAFCSYNPILPHHLGCAHIFCYTCLKGNLIADSKYECPLCKHQNANSECYKVDL